MRGIAGGKTVDPLYGPVGFDPAVDGLISSPVVQRLRHVRLSNIDSLDMPGVANVSRFEHVVGTAYLAQRVSQNLRLTDESRLRLVAAALLHDWAISSYGHLVEEALQYAGTGFDHELLWRQIESGEKPEEIGGIERQVLVGRETGLYQWAVRLEGAAGPAKSLLSDIKDCIHGNGHLGKLIASDVDLDNLDNVYRLAFHMGREVDRGVPSRLADAICEIDKLTGMPVFRREARSDFDAWRSVRRDLYQHLMLAEDDFAGKIMLIYAALRAYQTGELRESDWSRTDYDFLVGLLRSPHTDVKEAAERWVAGDTWDLAPLMWLEGSRPPYPELLRLSHTLTLALGRPTFCYGIKDKRDRALTLNFEGQQVVLGETPKRWLFGLGSPARRRFTSAETERIKADLSSAFSVDPSRIRPAAAESESRQPSLL